MNTGNFVLFLACVSVHTGNKLGFIQCQIFRTLKNTEKGCNKDISTTNLLTLKVLVTTIDAQWDGMGDVRSARYEPALLPPCPTIRVLSYSN